MKIQQDMISESVKQWHGFFSSKHFNFKCIQDPPDPLIFYRHIETQKPVQVTAVFEQYHTENSYFNWGDVQYIGLVDIYLGSKP